MTRLQNGAAFALVGLLALGTGALALLGGNVGSTRSETGECSAIRNGGRYPSNTGCVANVATERELAWLVSTLPAQTPISVLSVAMHSPIWYETPAIECEHEHLEPPPGHALIEYGSPDYLLNRRLHDQVLDHNSGLLRSKAVKARVKAGCAKAEADWAKFMEEHPRGY